MNKYIIKPRDFKFLNGFGGNMRILIDTNIVIYREDNKIISDNLQKLNGFLNKSEYKIIVHPASITEIKGDKDEKSSVLSSGYPVGFHRDTIRRTTS